MTDDIMRLAAGDVAAMPLWQRLTAAWLWSYRESADTRDAYQRDVADLVAWCQEHHLDPLVLSEVDAIRYAALLANQPRPRTGRPLDADSVRRKLTVLTSWYTQLIRGGACTVANPFEHVRRPAADVDHMATPGLTESELVALVAAAPAGTKRAVVWLLAETGARVSEACNVDIGDLSMADGYRVVTLRMKRSKTRVRRISPELYAALRAEAGERRAGPLFLGRQGQRISRNQVWRIVTAASTAAGIEGKRRSPHSVRRAVITISGQRGASLEDRQHSAGHSDPRTTQRYDRAARSLDRDPSALMAELLTPNLTPAERVAC